MEETSTPLHQFLGQLHQCLHQQLSMPHRIEVVFECDNAKVLPKVRSRTIKAITCTAGDCSRWMSSSSGTSQSNEAEQARTSRGVARTLSPQKPQRRSSIEMPPRSTSPPRMPQRPEGSPPRRVVKRTLTPKMPQRRSSIALASDDLDSKQGALGRCHANHRSTSPLSDSDSSTEPQAIKVAPSAA